MCDLCIYCDDDLTGCAEYGHDFGPCEDCDDESCELMSCIYCGEQY